MKRILRNILLFVVSAACAGACTHASAQTAGFNGFGSWAYEWANGEFRGVLTGPNGFATSYPMGPSAVGQTVSNGSGGVTWSRSGPVTLSGAAGSQAATATLTATRTVGLGQLARGAVSRVRGGPVGVLGGLVVSAGLEWVGDQWMRRQLPEGSPNVVNPGGDYYTDQNGCLRLEVGQTGVNTFANGKYAVFTVTYSNLVADGFIQRNTCVNRPHSAGKFPGLWAKSFDVPYSPETETVPASDSDIQSAIETGLTSSPSSAPAVADQVLSGGGELQSSEPKLTGPASVTTPSRTSTSATGSQTSQTTYNITYNNNSYSYASSTTTTTKDAQGNTTDTTTRDTSPDPGDVEDTPAVHDTAMPSVPTLYERKYPDGIVGVWASRKSELQETGFSAALESLMPDIPDGTGCPQFSLPAGNIAGFAFPGGNLGPPCWVWPWVKVVIVITSLFLARSLIFGG